MPAYRKALDKIARPPGAVKNDGLILNPYPLWGDDPGVEDRSHHDAPGIDYPGTHDVVSDQDGYAPPQMGDQGMSEEDRAMYQKPDSKYPPIEKYEDLYYRNLDEHKNDTAARAMKKMMEKYGDGVSYGENEEYEGKIDESIGVPSELSARIKPREVEEPEPHSGLGEPMNPMNEQRLEQESDLAPKQKTHKDIMMEGFDPFKKKKNSFTPNY